MHGRRSALVFGSAPIALLGLVALVTVALGPSPAAAQAPVASRVLVMPFAASVDANAPGGAASALWLGEAAAVLLGDNLSSLGVAVLSRDERVDVFSRLQLPMSAALTRATMIRVGELIGATDIVLGEVHLGDRLQVKARLIQVSLGREVPVASDDAPLADIFALFGRVAGRVASSTGRVRPAAPAAAAMPLDAFENYVKGLVAATPATEQRFLEAASREMPNDPRVLMALWRVYRTESMPEKALAAANAIPATAVSARAARFAVALSLIDLKRYDGAYQELTTLDMGRREAPISNALGVVQLRRTAPAGTPSPATFFGRAAQQDPYNTDYLFNLGYAQALAQSPSEALTSLREAVRFDAANAEAHLVMAAVLHATNRLAEAQRELELARDLGAAPDAAAAASAGRIPASLERLDASLASNPRLDAAIAAPAQRDQQETAAFHLARGRELVDAHKDREATSELKRAIYLAPYEDEPHLLLGRVYQRSGQLSAAIDEFKVALWCRETAAAHVALGNARLDAGDREGARKDAERALALAPNASDARDLLRRLGG